MQLWLKYKSEDGALRRVPVSAEKFTIGRHSDNDLCIPSNQLSRRHVEIDRYEDAFILTDAGSSNSTTLNRNPLQRPTALQNGDRINLGGGAEIEVEINAAASAAAAPKLSPAGSGDEDPDSSTENAAEKAEADAVAQAELTSGVKVADFAPAITQSAAPKKSGMGIFFILAPVMVLFILVIGGLFLWLLGGSKENEVAKKTGSETFGYADDEDDPKPNKNKKTGNGDTDKTPTPSSKNNDNGNSSAPVNSSSTPATNDAPGNSAPISSENDTIEKNALSFLRRIASSDPNPVLTQKQLGELNSAIKSVKSSAALKDNLQALKKEMGQLEPFAKSKNLRPQFLAAAALTKLGGSRGDPLATAQAMAGSLNDLSNQIANDFSDDSLMIIAAYQDGGKSGMPSMLANLTKNSPNGARSVRTIWYLHDNKKINDAQYNFALQFLAFGTITQNPKDFNVQAEAVVFN